MENNTELKTKLKGIKAKHLAAAIKFKIKESYGIKIGAITGTTDKAKAARANLKENGLCGRTLYDICKKGTLLDGTRFKTINAILVWLGYNVIQF